MSNLKIIQKFWLICGLFGIALAIELVAFYAMVNTIKVNSQSLAETEIPILIKSAEIKLAVVQVQQWLTDISATRGQDGLDDGFKEAEKNATLFYNLIAELKQLDNDNQQQYTDMVSAFNQYYQAGKTMAEAYVKEGPEAGNKMMTPFDQAADAISQRIEPFIERTQKRSQALLSGQDSALATDINFVIAGAVLLVMVIGVVFFTFMGIVNAIPVISRVINTIAKGNINEKAISLQRNDELEDLLGDIEKMKVNLRNIILQVTNSSQHLYKAVKQVSTIASSTHGQMHTEQHAIDQLATAMNELSATANEVANSARISSESADSADKEVREGNSMVKMTIDKIDGVATNVEQGVEVIGKLHQESVNIGAILDVIRGIADQTNLLALNAAIEAARAGEQGRGFAVVADEVRTLAQRTQDSIQEIQTMIQRLQVAADDATLVMGKGQKSAQESVQQILQTGDKLQRIENAVAKITEMSNQIANASKEQSLVAEDMSRNITGISDISKNVIDESLQLTGASSELSELASELQESVVHFKV